MPLSSDDIAEALRVLGWVDHDPGWWEHPGIGNHDWEQQEHDDIPHPDKPLIVVQALEWLLEHRLMVTVTIASDGTFVVVTFHSGKEFDGTGATLGEALLQPVLAVAREGAAGADALRKEKE